MKQITVILILLALALITSCKTEDAAAAADERVVIMGEITRTVGNMITIDLIERIEPRELTEEELSQRAARREMTEEELSQLRERFGEGEGGGRSERREMTEEELSQLRERFGEGEGGGFRRVNPGEDGEEPPEGFVGGGRNYTGESKEIIIPAGAPVLEVSYANGEQAQTEISLDKLSAGDTIEITYATDGETVAKIVKQAAFSRMGGVFRGDFPGANGEAVIIGGGDGGDFSIAIQGEGAPAGGIRIEETSGGR